MSATIVLFYLPEHEFGLPPVPIGPTPEPKMEVS